MKEVLGLEAAASLCTLCMVHENGVCRSLLVPFGLLASATRRDHLPHVSNETKGTDDHSGTIEW